MITAQILVCMTLRDATVRSSDWWVCVLCCEGMKRERVKYHVNIYVAITSRMNIAPVCLINRDSSSTTTNWGFAKKRD